MQQAIIDIILAKILNKYSIKTVIGFADTIVLCVNKTKSGIKFHSKNRYNYFNFHIHRDMTNVT